MKNLILAATAFAGVLGAAAWLLHARSSNPPPLVGARPGDALPAVEVVADRVRAVRPAPISGGGGAATNDRRPDGQTDGSVLLARVSDALGERRASLEASADEAMVELWTERIGMRLDLTPDQLRSVQGFLGQVLQEARDTLAGPDLDEPGRREAQATIESRVFDFVAQEFGAEKAEAFRVAEHARVEAVVEHRARQALDTVAQVADLTPGQMDALFSAFAEKERGRGSLLQPGEVRPQFSYAFEEGPRVAEPFALAQRFLTADQRALLEQTQSSEAAMRQRSVQTAAEVMREVFQEALGR